MTMGLPASRVDEMLATVGLTDVEAARQLRNYSLGMKQRLGIAHALLGDPQILILDEPANGLDPGGIRWMRGLLRSYADRGGTVLLSSHLLHEVELIADRIVMIGNGRIVANGDRASLVELGGGAVTIVRSPDHARLGAVLAQAGLTSPRHGDGFHVLAAPEVVGRVVAEHRVALSELRVQHDALEDVFLALTAADARDAIDRRVVINLMTSSRPTSPRPESPAMTSLIATTTTSSIGSLGPIDRPIPIETLIAVELRKTFNTRAGRWLAGTIVGGAALVMLVMIVVGLVQDRTFALVDMVQFANFVPMGLLLPVLGVLAVTGEWSQRTNVVTFTLEPRRGRGPCGQACHGRNLGHRGERGCVRNRVRGPGRVRPARRRRRVGCVGGDVRPRSRCFT